MQWICVWRMSPPRPPARPAHQRRRRRLPAASGGALASPPRPALLARRLCCLCGTSIAPNPTNMCVNCIRTQVDITEGIQKQVTVLWCKSCGRYLQPPKHWLKADLGACLGRGGVGRECA